MMGCICSGDERTNERMKERDRMLRDRKIRVVAKDTSRKKDPKCQCQMPHDHAERPFAQLGGYIVKNIVRRSVWERKNAIRYWITDKLQAIVCYLWHCSRNNTVL